jgi:hypothetical protein
MKLKDHPHSEVADPAEFMGNLPLAAVTRSRTLAGHLPWGNSGDDRDDDADFHSGTEWRSRTAWEMPSELLMASNSKRHLEGGVTRDSLLLASRSEPGSYLQNSGGVVQNVRRRPQWHLARSVAALQRAARQVALGRGPPPPPPAPPRSSPRSPRPAFPLLLRVCSFSIIGL